MKWKQGEKDHSNELRNLEEMLGPAYSAVAKSTRSIS
jgi:hypothetical protein